jgi:hypothetical protein
MNKIVNRFSRFVATMLIFSVSYMFCSCPVNPISEESSSQQKPSPLTPGVGNPRYFFLDSDGNYTATEEDSHGRTGLIVEGNEFAEGVLVYSDDTGTEDRVGFAYEDSIVSMSFKKDSNFPHSMNISVDSKEYYAYVSQYNAVNNTYHVTFISDNYFEMMDNVVLNENIFTLYEDDPELSDSQNRRMANMIVAMGVWGSLYATFDEQLSDPPPIVFSRGIQGLSKILRGVSKAFSYVAVVAAVVAVVVVPIVTFINPTAGMVFAEFTIAVAIGSAVISGLTGILADYFEEQEQEETPVKLPFIPLVYVSRVGSDGSETKIKYNDNGVHEEFHTPVGEELLVKFYIPGFNTDNMPDWNKMVWFDEPEICKQNGEPDDVINISLFEPHFPVFTKEEDKEVFFVKFKRINPYNKTSDINKINFCFIINFEDKDKNPLNLTVNGYEGGFYFRLPSDDEPILYKNMVVIYFCTKENCPDNQ